MFSGRTLQRTFALALTVSHWLTALNSTLAQENDRHVLNDIFGEAYIAENVGSVRRQAAALSAAARFEFLASWILPGRDHPDFRMAGEFTPTDPSPLAMRLEPLGAGRGAELVSPVFDLLDVAAETGKLQQLRDRVVQIPEPEDELNRRARAALLALTDLELGQPEAAEPALAVLQSLVSEAKPAALHNLWPETLVVHRGAQRFSSNAAIGDLLSDLYSHRTMRPDRIGADVWHTHIVSLVQRYWHMQRGGTRESYEADSSLADWIPVVRARARSRGDGCAHAQWLRRGDEAHHVAGHQEEYLFYRIPLRGDFEVAADIGAHGTTQFFAAGGFFGPKHEPDLLETGTFRGGAALRPFNPPFSKFDRWVRCRAAFRDGAVRLFVNGRLVGETPLAPHGHPWVGVRSWWRNDARFRNVQIAGNPEIPEAVLMSGSKDLTGWLPYFDDTAGYDGADWQWIGDPHSGGQILGRRREGLRGTYCESLLRYHRPLLGGTVEYEFFYEPGEAVAHPALDRLSLVLDPRGVRIHWITDGKYDRTSVPPENLLDEPQSRRGPQDLPLRPGQWNRVALSLAEGAVTLTLNGQVVFQRELEADNRRTFGLFHFAGDTEARVRNVLMRGDWPRTLPAPSHRELADTAVASLNADLPRLKSLFAHDFAADGLPDKFFELRAQNPQAQVSRTSAGVHTAVASGGNWSQAAIVPRFALLGDFDMEASFDRLDINDSDKESAIHLAAYLQDAQQHQARLVRGQNGAGRQFLKGQLSRANPDGTRRYMDSLVSDEAVSGRLRIARRGRQIYTLFAEGDSEVFRIVGQETAPAGDVRPEGIHLIVVANGVGKAGVVWKDMTLRAERMLLFPAPGQEGPRELCVMNADGSELRVLTRPLAGFTHLGSPEWSADGQRIALDMSQGSVSTSHINVVDVESGQTQDLGSGCMPSFSPDGKRIAFSHSGEGVMIMNSDGSNRQVIDGAGWGVQWSPDGKHFAYGKSGNIVVMDSETRQQRLLLTGDDAARYNYIYWNLGWSHDSRWIAFKARNQQTRDYELAAAPIDERDGLQVLYTTSGSLNADFTWSPDNERVLFSMHRSGDPAPSLFLVDRTAPAAPELLPGQPVDRRILDCAWSPKGQRIGQRIVFSSQLIPQPLEWTNASQLD